MRRSLFAAAVLLCAVRPLAAQVRPSPTQTATVYYRMDYSSTNPFENMTGYQSASIQVDYAFLLCPGGEIHIQYAPRPETVETGVTYHVRGPDPLAVPAGIDPPRPEVVRFAGTVLAWRWGTGLVGTFADDLAVAYPGYGCYGQSQKVTDLEELGFEDASPEEIQALLDDLHVGETETLPALRSAEVESALAAQGVTRAQGLASSGGSSGSGTSGGSSGGGRFASYECRSPGQRYACEVLGRARELARNQRYGDAADEYSIIARATESELSAHRTHARQQLEALSSLLLYEQGDEIRAEADRAFDAGDYATATRLYQSLFNIGIPEYSKHHEHARQRIAFMEENAGWLLAQQGLNAIGEAGAEFEETLDELGVPVFAGGFVGYNQASPLAGSADGYVPERYTIGVGIYRVFVFQMRGSHGSMPTFRYDVYDDDWNTVVDEIAMTATTYALGGSLGLGLPFGPFAPYIAAGGDLYFGEADLLGSDWQLSWGDSPTNYSTTLTAGLNLKLPAFLGLGVSFNRTFMAGWDMDGVGIYRPGGDEYRYNLENQAYSPPSATFDSVQLQFYIRSN